MISLFDQANGGISLANILRIEDSPDVLALQCAETRIPIWPNIRVAFFRLIMGDLLYNASNMAFPVSGRSVRAAVTLGRAALHNAALHHRGQLRSDLLINTEAIGDELIDGRWYNRYVDPFGDLPSSQAVVLTDMFEWRWRTPRHNDRLYFHAPLQAEATLRGKLSGSTAAREQAAALVALVSVRARTLLDWDIGEERRTAFVAQVAAKIQTIPLRYRRYRALIEQVRPKLLLGSSGCYGFHAPLIAAARDLGVVTAEYQHGAISEGHDAYNFAPAVFASAEYRRTLPQYLLTYGDWWGDHIHVPAEIVSLGYPARAMKLARMDADVQPKRTVLLLSDGVEFALYLDLARAIAAAVAPLGLDVAVRPHPMERTRVLADCGAAAGEVRIDATPDIYASFRSARAVVSEVSTGLFEAVGLAERIVMLDTTKARFAYPDHPFAMADSAEAVIRLISDREAAMPRIAPTALWAPDWRENYRRFLAEKVGYDVS